jgi:catechol 2,3-dioxygenase-like lactoylglutathione lyase family enzyme
MRGEAVNILTPETVASAKRETKQPVSPGKLAHVVFRSSRYADMVAWYQSVLNAKVAFANDVLTFLSYDDEHHRIAVINVAGLEPQKPGVAGLHHVAFTFNTLADLLGTYLRLRDAGITPVFVINHGPTTSMYYEDPDANQIELQIDNYDNIDDATRFFYTPAFQENPIGVEFDPEQLLERYRAGEPEHTLKARPRSGPKGLKDIKLR